MKNYITITCFTGQHIVIGVLTDELHRKYSAVTSFDPPPPL
jgi:phosphopantetheine adenylyltransferase